MTAEAPSASAATGAQAALQHFWLLSDADVSKRISAAEGLIADILADQDAHDAGESSKPAPAQSDLPGCSTLAAYCLRRLARGLPSSNGAARQGFALAFSGALERLAARGAVAPDHAVALVEATLPPSTLRGSEGRDALLGRLFALAALSRAGIATADPARAAATAAALLRVGAGRSFLLEPACVAVIDLINALPPADARAACAACEPLKELLSGPADAASPEALLVAISLWDVLGGVSCALLPEGAEGEGVAAYLAAPGTAPHPRAAAAAFFAPAHLRSVAPALGRTTGCAPRMHSVWPVLVSLLVPGFRPRRLGAASAPQSSTGGVLAAELRQFWSAVVEGELMPAPSHEKKALGLQLLQLLMPHAGTECAPTLLSHQVVHCIVTNSQHPDSHLHAASKKAVERLARVAERSEDASLRAAVAVALKSYGRVGFDRLTKTQTSEAILGSLEDSQLASYVTSLESKLADAIAAPRPDAGDTDARPDPAAGCAWAAEQLLGAIRTPGASPAVKSHALRALATAAFLAGGKSADARRKKAFAETLASSPSQDDHDLAAASTALSDLASLLQLYLLASPELIDPSVSEDMLGIARAIAGGARGASLSKKPPVQKKRKSKKKEGGSDDDDVRDDADEDGGEPAWMDVVVDVSMDLLSRPTAPLPSAPLRTAVGVVFRHAGAHLTPVGLEDMLRVLLEPLAGGGGDDEGDVMEVDSEEEGGSDVEEGGSAVEEAESEAGSEGGSDGEESADPGMSEDEDDAGMFRMDKHLGEMLRANKERKSSERTAKQTRLNLKLRVVALLEEVLRRHPGSPQACRAVVPTLRALKMAAGPGGDAQLAQRIQSFLITTLCKCKARSGASVPLEELAAALRKALGMAARSAPTPAATKLVHPAALAAVAFLLHALLYDRGGEGPRPGALDAASEVVATACSGMLQRRRSKILPRFFADALQRHPELAPALVAAAAAGCGTGRNETRRVDAAEVLAAAMSVNPKLHAKAVGAALRPQLAHVAAAVEACAAGEGWASSKRRAAMATQLARCVELLVRVYGRDGVQLEEGRGAEVGAAAARGAAEEGASQRLVQALRKIAGVFGAPVVAGPRRGKGGGEGEKGRAGKKRKAGGDGGEGSARKKKKKEEKKRREKRSSKQEQVQVLIEDPLNPALGKVPEPTMGKKAKKAKKQ
ncbi:unnamed protein product [Pedinophyceae sp. YPF-701]|nr:unnamed protein product [Pedinophyceae sp. YPF-701]